MGNCQSELLADMIDLPVYRLNLVHFVFVYRDGVCVRVCVLGGGGGSEHRPKINKERKNST